MQDKSLTPQQILVQCLSIRLQAMCFTMPNTRLTALAFVMLEIFMDA